MSVRPLFLPTINPDRLFESVNIEFKWVPGLSFQQKQRNVASMHSSIPKSDRALEVSTKSTVELGRNLSAFNLCISAGGD